MRLEAGVLDVYSCWWAWAGVVGPGSVGSASLWFGITWFGDGWSRSWSGSEIWYVGPVCLVRQAPGSVELMHLGSVVGCRLVRYRLVR